MWHLLGLALLLTFGAWMVSLVVSGVRTGRIRHTDLTSTYALRKQPLRFVFVAVVFLAFAALAFYFAFESWQSFWAVDRCLDGGGAWDYEVELTCPPETGRFRMGVLLNQAEEDDGAKEPIQRGADHRRAA